MVKIVLGDANHFKSPEDLPCPDSFNGTKDAVFVTQSPTRFLSPFHLNLVVVGAALFVIDFDDSRVIV